MGNQKPKNPVPWLSVWQHMPVVPAFGRWRQDENLRLICTTSDAVPKNKRRVREAAKLLRSWLLFITTLLC